MQNFLSLWLNAGVQITHGGQVQRPRQKDNKTTTKWNRNYFKNGVTLMDDVKKIWLIIRFINMCILDL